MVAKLIMCHYYFCTSTTETKSCVCALVERKIKTKKATPLPAQTQASLPPSRVPWRKEALLSSVNASFPLRMYPKDDVASTLCSQRLSGELASLIRSSQPGRGSQHVERPGQGNGQGQWAGSERSLTVLNKCSFLPGFRRGWFCFALLFWPENNQDA